MGKKHRARIETNSGEDPEQGRIRAWWGRRKQDVRDRVEDALDKATAENQRKHYKRWMEGSHCHTPKLIKWDDPQISLECKLCDPRNLKLIKKGKRREEFFEICSPEEIDIYLNAVGLNGEKYTDLEDPHIIRDLIKGIRQSYRDAKRKRGEDLTPEEEKAIDELIDDDEEEDAENNETTD